MNWMDDEMDWDALADEMLWREADLRFAALEAAGPPAEDVEVFDPALVLDGPFEALAPCLVCAVGGEDDCGIEDDYDPTGVEAWVDEARMADRFENAMGW